MEELLSKMHIFQKCQLAPLSRQDLGSIYWKRLISYSASASCEDLSRAGRERSLMKGVTNPDFLVLTVIHIDMLDWTKVCISVCCVCECGEGVLKISRGDLRLHLCCLLIVPSWKSSSPDCLSSIKEKFSSNEARHESWLNAAATRWMAALICPRTMVKNWIEEQSALKADVLASCLFGRPTPERSNLWFQLKISIWVILGGVTNFFWGKTLQVNMNKYFNLKALMIICDENILHV